MKVRVPSFVDSRRTTQNAPMQDCFQSIELIASRIEFFVQHQSHRLLPDTAFHDALQSSEKNRFLFKTASQQSCGKAAYIGFRRVHGEGTQGTDTADKTPEEIAQCVRDSAKPDWREESYVERTAPHATPCQGADIPPGIPRRDEVVIQDNDSPA